MSLRYGEAKNELDRTSAARWEQFIFNIQKNVTKSRRFSYFVTVRFLLFGKVSRKFRDFIISWHSRALLIPHFVMPWWISARDCHETSEKPIFRDRFQKDLCGIVTNLSECLVFVTVFQISHAEMSRKLRIIIFSWRSRPYCQCLAGSASWGYRFLCKSTIRDPGRSRVRWMERVYNPEQESSTLVLGTGKIHSFVFWGGI